MEYFRSNPEQVKRVTRFEFRPEALSDPLLFTIPESLARLFATQTALNAAVGSGLTGISFREVWASRP